MLRPRWITAHVTGSTSASVTGEPTSEARASKPRAV